MTFTAAIGVGGWEAIVYENGRNIASDSPLPLALAQVVQNDHFLYKLLVGIGLLGLIASFHGIILAGGRGTLEFGRVGYFPKKLGNVHPRYKTPTNALIFNTGVGLIALFSGKTGEIITIACFGGLTLYIISMLSFFALRKKHPSLHRPFKVPMYPVFPIVALFIASVSLISMIYYNMVLAYIFFAIIGASYAYYYLFILKNKMNL